MEVVSNTLDETCNSPIIDNRVNIFDGTNNTEVYELYANQTCINHDDLTRCWYTYIPESAKNRTDPVPIVLDLHGYTGCAYSNSRYTGWESIAEEKGFAIIWPQGNMDASLTESTCWNAGACCCRSQDTVDSFLRPVDIDDTRFLRQVISNTVESVNNNNDIMTTIDTKRIYLAGHSNGCMMGHAMAAYASDLVAAVCCHSGILVSDGVSPDYQPTPIHTVHGDLDIVVPYDSTTSWGLSMIENAMDNFEFWGATNGCKKNSTTVDSSNLYATHSFSDCTDNATVQLLQVFKAGHFPYLGFNVSYPGEPPNVEFTTVDTTQLSWDFCSNYQSESNPSLPDFTPYVSPYTFVDLPNTAVPQSSNDGSYLSTNAVPGVLFLIYFMLRL